MVAWNRASGYLLGASLSIMILCSSTAWAQFSPGDLSNAHKELEGLSNCSQCHDIGNEISGKKCAVCHTEIQHVIDAKHGFHARNASKKCVDCHKEHLGRNSRTVKFDQRSFDHKQTGYSLLGKHTNAKCEKCHAEQNIIDSGVRDLVMKKGRQTYLGLMTNCSSCHEDVHKSSLGKECQTCHTESGWSPATRFDHSTTKFPLVGKHAPVSCEKCHTAISVKNKDKAIFLVTQAFQDCSPCHKTPHRPDFSPKACRECHAPTDWKNQLLGKFDHSQTKYPLKGKHASVKCEDCHGTGKSKRLKLDYKNCMDCHKVYHQNIRKVKSDACEPCHDVAGFTPSTFTLVSHAKTTFPLNGAHVALPCAKCHRSDPKGKSILQFAETKCVECHKDIHRGQFATVLNKKGCEGCHNATAFKPSTFDHATTTFPLKGKHAKIECAGCHKADPKTAVRVNGVLSIVYKIADQTCESCHEDRHDRQFAVAGKSKCESCHTPELWTTLIFDHNTQSTFSLDGAHKKVECAACHPAERRGGRVVIRFKPLDAKCESCHKQQGFRNG